MAVVWASPLCFIICCRVLIISGGSLGEADITKSHVVGETCLVIDSDYCFVNQSINQLLICKSFCGQSVSLLGWSINLQSVSKSEVGLSISQSVNQAGNKVLSK